MPRVYPPIESKTANHALPPSLVEIVAGFSSGIISTLAVHPFDVIKTRLQVDLNSASQVGGSFRVLRDIGKSEGVLHGLYRGLSPNIVGNSVSWALYFMWYGNIKDLIHTYRGPDKQLLAVDYFTASGVAGILTNVFTNPIWVIKTRMLSTSRNAPGAYRSIGHGAAEIYKREGFYGFYRGLVPSMIGVSHGAIQFMAYEKLKIWRADQIAAKLGVDKQRNVKGSHEALCVVKKEKSQVELGNWDFLALSALSKIFAGSVTYPYQVVRARLQTYDAPLLYKGAGDVVKQVWKHEGLSGFYKGLGPNIVRVLPSTCVTFLVYENTKRYLPLFYEETEK